MTLHETQPPPPSQPPDMRPFPGVRWGPLDLAIGVGGVLVMFFLLGTLIILPVTETYGEKSAEGLASQAVTVMLWDVGMVLFVYWLARRRGSGWRDLGFRAPFSHQAVRPRDPWMKLARTCVAAYVASVAIVNVYAVLIRSLGLDEELLPGQQLGNETFDYTLVVALMGLAVVVAAPVAEEVFFRGFLYGGLRQRFALPVAALLSGSLFSLAHGDPGLVLPFTLVGAVLAYAYERTGTLIASMSTHFTFNAISFFILVLIPEAR